MRSVRLSNLIRSEPFKAILRTLCVFLVLFSIASWTLVKSVEATLREDLQMLIQIETELLNQIYRDEGKAGLLTAINQMGSQGRAPERAYGLFDERSLNLTGPISVLPDFIGIDTRELGVLSSGRIAGRYVLRVDQIDTFTVVIGRDRSIISNATRGLIRGLVIFGALLAVSTLFLGLRAARRSQQRLDEMEAALRAVSAGQMDARLPIGTQDDQFDRVAKRMNTNLAQLERLMSSVRTTASAIAHDLKTPLSHAQIAMHQAADAVASNDLASKKIGDALAETDKLNSLFETILRLSRIQSSRDRSKFAVTSLRELADKAITFLQPLAEENGQTLSLSGAEARIKADPDMIQQAMINLLQNACVHSGSGADIRAVIQSNEFTVSLMISDNGPGISEDRMEAVLEPFVRGETDRNTPGHGLGLAMVLAIAELHDAKMTLNNTSTGFEVSLIFPILKNF